MKLLFNLGQGALFEKHFLGLLYKVCTLLGKQTEALLNRQRHTRGSVLFKEMICVGTFAMAKNLYLHCNLCSSVGWHRPFSLGVISTKIKHNIKNILFTGDHISGVGFFCLFVLLYILQ